VDLAILEEEWSAQHAADICCARNVGDREPGSG
jgi:hypothetical protein